MINRPMDTVELLLNRVAASLPESRAALRRLKIAVAAETRSDLIRNDALLSRYRREVAEGLRHADTRLERILTLNRIRSESGIATVTVITEPFACPGRCVYCPTEERAPKSYLTNEPAVMRALRSEYDPFLQVHRRLAALDETGHPTDKVELIVKGGTWSFYPEAYQQWFLQRCLEAATAFPSGAGRAIETVREAVSDASFARAEAANEAASSRVIGTTIETRPDYITEEEVRRLRQLGVTRVELGVQTLEEPVLELIARDHGTAQVRAATQLLKDAGCKVAYHLMPNLPGATPESDLDTMRCLFADAGYQPDTLKIYPCVVVASAELFRWWRDGRYQPYDDGTLTQLLVRMKQLVPPHVRIERIIRDIPSTSIEAGCLTTNLREAVQERLRAEGGRCRCLRCRQVRDDAGGAFTLVRRSYDASSGTELFLSFEDEGRDRLASFLRLRMPSAAPAAFPALCGAALVRELHTYGPHLPLSARQDGAAQHRGFGARLLQEAERIAREEFRLARIAVIAGVGARPYYRRLGYALHDTYMVKAL